MSKCVCRECGGIVTISGNPNQGSTTYGTCAGCKSKEQTRRTQEESRRLQAQRIEEERQREAQRQERRRHEESSREREKQHRERELNADRRQREMLESTMNRERSSGRTSTPIVENNQQQVELEVDDSDYCETQEATSKGCIRKGFCCLLLFLGILAALFFLLIIIGIIFDDKKIDNNIPPISETKKEIIKDKISSEIKDKDEIKEDAEPERSSIPSNKETKKLNTDENKVSTFENASLPLILITTGEFSLLDKSGKETVIPIGTKITIVNRRPQGTLEIHIDGSLYVGNENRILGKCRIN